MELSIHFQDGFHGGHFGIGYSLGGRGAQVSVGGGDEPGTGTVYCAYKTGEDVGIHDGRKELGGVRRVGGA